MCGVRVGVFVLARAGMFLLEPLKLYCRGSFSTPVEMLLFCPQCSNSLTVPYPPQILTLRAKEMGIVADRVTARFRVPQKLARTVSNAAHARTSSS